MVKIHQKLLKLVLKLLPVQMFLWTTLDKFNDGFVGITAVLTYDGKNIKIIR